MKPQDIRAELVRRKITQSSIARQLKITPTTVGQVIEGRAESRRVKEAIAAALQMPLKKVFPKKVA